jgi:hypothetical protein
LIGCFAGSVQNTKRAALTYHGRNGAADWMKRRIGGLNREYWPRVWSM